MKACNKMQRLLVVIVTMLCGQSAGDLPGQVGFVDVHSKLGLITGIKFDLDTLKHPVFQGKADGFLGIPFAQPPIGNLRFQSPIPTGNFTEPLNATKYSTKCIQNPPDVPDFSNLPNLIQDEDCLYLNIFRPTGIDANAKLPVMIWIYGGGFVVGSLTRFSPTEGIITNIVSRGVILVAINYRLGFFGFFTTYTSAFPSNLGLRDQIAAFKWVKSNIDSFGGDPAKVTIFGESAGGCSVSMHTVSPLSKGTFDQGIIESGSVAGFRQLCLDTKSNIDASENINALIAKQLCNITDAEWQSQSFSRLSSCLQIMPWETIINITNTLNLIPGPGIDGQGGFLPENPENLLKSRQNVPMIIGANRDESATGFVLAFNGGGANLSDFDERLFDEVAKSQLMIEQTGGQLMQDIVYPILDLSYRQTFCPSPPLYNDSISWIQIVSEMGTDFMMRSGALREAKLWRDVNKNPNVFLYNFEYSADAVRFQVPGFNPPPVAHTEELAYVFLWELDGFFNLSLLSARDRIMIDYVGTMWTDFAKYGNPTPANSSLPFTWRPFDVTNNYLSINNGSTGTKVNYYPKADQIFNQLIPSISAKIQQSSSMPTSSTPTYTTPSTPTQTIPSSTMKSVSSCVTLMLCIFIGLSAA